MEENNYLLFDNIPIHCERGHRAEIIGFNIEREEKSKQVKKCYFLLTALCENCDNKLITFNLTISIARKIFKKPDLPRIKGIKNPA